MHSGDRLSPRFNPLVSMVFSHRFFRNILCGGLFFGLSFTLVAQQAGLRGKVVDLHSGKGLPGVLVKFEDGGAEVLSDSAGIFFLRFYWPRTHVNCQLSLKGYITRTFTNLDVSRGLDLGKVTMEPEGGPIYEENLIPLSETDVFEEDVIEGSSGFLQASRDIFLNRAAFDFSPAFFRIRGYDNRNAAVFLNGIPMNRFSNGRPQWNTWGGLNDVTRNQQYSIGLQPLEAGFGGIMGTTAIQITPAAVRKGFRLTVSASNRNYAGRLMATYNSGMGSGKWGFLTSVSKRAAGQGYMQGTPYDAYSVLGAIAYRPTPQHEVTLVGIYASNLRGRSSALSAETLSLGGRLYNPYWGWQKGKVRNSRMRYIAEPFIALRYDYSGSSFRYTMAGAYREGIQFGTRLSYFNAPNPDPVYYRNLPSFYWNGPVGPNLQSAEAARKGFENSSQIDWEALYSINARGNPGQEASYILQADSAEEKQFSVNTFGAWEVARGWQIRAGALLQQSTIQNYGRLDDLLGAAYHGDADPFSGMRNDLEGVMEKKVGDRIGYDYTIGVSQWQTFLSLEASGAKWTAFLSGHAGKMKYQRTGNFRNEKYPDTSLGAGKDKGFAGYGVKSGLTYQITGRHWIAVNGVLLQRPPVLRNTFINPRERHEFVEKLQSERLTSAEVSYFLRGTVLTSRLSGYYTRIMDQSKVNFFFSDTGYGSGFIQEVATGIDVLHKGVELGLELDLTPAVQLSTVVALGEFTYASDPDLSIYFQPGERPGDLDQAGGTLALGPAGMKGNPFSAGPSRAFSIGLHYRGPSYWWIGTTLNYLSGQYPSPSFLRHTASFLLDPETGVESEGILREAYPKSVEPVMLPPVYLVNLLGGKSWKKGPHYVSLFLSVANLLDAFYLSGGYQSGRNGHLKQWYDDHLSGNPSFGTRYWPGFGRTFFLNLSWSFI